MKNEKLFIWGTGYCAEQTNRLYSDALAEIGVDGYIDNNPEKCGSIFYGVKVFSPEILRNTNKCVIYIATYKRNEIINQIKRDYPAHYESILENGFFKKVCLIKRYEKSQDADAIKVIDYLNDHPLDIFNYSYKEKYYKMDIPFFKDENLYYTIHNGKRLYFSSDYDTEERARDYYISLLLEQDNESPHKYTDQEFDVDNDSILADVGAAEGIFSLDKIEKCKKVYMFEPDKNWCEALRKTFAEYSDKVTIIEKCVSNFAMGNTITIDEAVGGDTIDFIKMDIEGEEFYALQGAEKTIANSPQMKCCVCTYHQEFAYYAIKDILERMGFETNHTDGYMWYIGQFNEMRAPVLRRGLIRARKND